MARVRSVTGRRPDGRRRSRSTRPPAARAPCPASPPSRPATHSVRAPRQRHRQVLGLRAASASSASGTSPTGTTRPRSRWATTSPPSTSSTGPHRHRRRAPAGCHPCALLDDGHREVLGRRRLRRAARQGDRPVGADHGRHRRATRAPRSVLGRSRPGPPTPALLINGTVSNCWGSTAIGQLGEHFGRRATPEMVRSSSSTANALSNIIALAAGG